MLLGLEASPVQLMALRKQTVLRVGGVELRGALGLDPGVQQGLTILGALGFLAFVGLVLGVSKSAEKRR
jgi:hypothetical protein